MSSVFTDLAAHARFFLVSLLAVSRVVYICRTVFIVIVAHLRPFQMLCVTDNCVYYVAPNTCFYYGLQAFLFDLFCIPTAKPAAKAHETILLRRYRYLNNADIIIIVFISIITRVLFIISIFTLCRSAVKQTAVNQWLRIKVNLLAIVRESFRVELFAQRYFRAEFAALIRCILLAFVSKKVWNKTNIYKYVTVD